MQTRPDDPLTPSAATRAVRRRRIGLVLGLLLAAAIGGTALPLVLRVRDISSGTGYTAWELCTRSFVSGDDMQRVRDTYIVPIVEPLPRIWSIDVRGSARVAVSTSLPTLAERRVAIFRPGLGCTLLPAAADEQQVRSRRLRVASEPPPDDRVWPLGDGEPETNLASDRDRAAFARGARMLFDAPGTAPDARQNSIALLVARAGHLIYEQYASGYARTQPQLGWSMTKTLTALIAGIFLSEHDVSLDARVGLTAWQHTAKAAITWRQLLNMAPGLAWDEGYQGASDVTHMLFSEADEAAYVASRPLVARPGSVFNYSTGFPTVAMKAMREQLGGSAQAIYDFYQQRLFAPLGMRRGVIEFDASGTPSGGARGVLRPRDWLRLGQLVLEHGAWGGAQLVPRSYIDFMLAPSPADAGYGGYIWRGAPAWLDPALRERLPRDLIYFAGHLGQFLIVVPSARLLVLRMGVAKDEHKVLAEVLALSADLIAR